MLQRIARRTLVVSLMLLTLVGAARAGEDLVARTYAQLDQLRDQKLEQLREYLHRVQGLARSAAQDQELIAFLDVAVRFDALQREVAPPPRAQAAIAETRQRVAQHYLAGYHLFYDILFVGPSGRVVHTIRQEGDTGRELFRPPHLGTGLVKRLREDDSAGFVDWEYYAASQEASAFFVEPVRRHGELLGWLILQCTIDKVNRIFDRADDLGETGEVFLVNRGRLMLTNSRFQAGTSILKQHLSAANISAKFAEGRGHKIVVDYRGERALTSFEVCSVLGTEWLLIAKIDEDEVITRAWCERDLEEPLLAAISTQQPPAVTPPRQGPACRVDLDEFRRVEPDQPILTYGVSTCTAVLVSRPGGFAYLGHASPRDRLYGRGDTDLVEHMVKRVRQFEVYPSEVRELRAVVVAPHQASTRGAIERLLAAGLFLDQIVVMHQPGARSADVRHDARTGWTWVRWLSEDGSSRWVRSNDVPNLGQLAASILGYEQAVRRADTALLVPSGG